jgi:hypothetical protein
VRLARAAASSALCLASASCGSDGSEKALVDPTTLSLQELCDTIVSGYEHDPSCAGHPKGLARNTCVAAADTVNPPTPDVSCSAKWRATLECAVRSGNYVCDPASGTAQLPGGGACKTEWTEYARCIGRLAGDVPTHFPWHPCEAARNDDAEGCSFVALGPTKGAAVELCFDSEQAACDCSCEYEHGVCSSSSGVLTCSR